MKEIWKDIPWFEWLYQVSNMGRVKNRHWKIIKGRSNGKYLKVNLYNKWISKQFSIHVLVMLTFIWPRPIENNGKSYDINHKWKDWNKFNNKLSNLEYCTKKENTKHKINVLWSTGIMESHKYYRSKKV